MKWKIRIFCKWLGWHSYFAGYDYLACDEVNTHARCKWCGYIGLIDSGGQLF